MTTITFDTHATVRALRDAGFEEKQAETIVRVILETHEGLLTREYFDARIQEYSTKNDLSELKVDLIKWMIGLFFAQCAFIIGILFKILP